MRLLGPARPEREGRRGATRGLGEEGRYLGIPLTAPDRVSYHHLGVQETGGGTASLSKACPPGERPMVSPMSRLDVLPMYPFVTSMTHNITLQRTGARMLAPAAERGVR